MRRAGWLIPTLYIVFLMLPIYWLLNMSLKSNSEILNEFTLWPRDLIALFPAIVRIQYFLDLFGPVAGKGKAQTGLFFLIKGKGVLSLFVYYLGNIQ